MEDMARDRPRSMVRYQNSSGRQPVAYFSYRASAARQVLVQLDRPLLEALLQQHHGLGQMPQRFP